MTFKKILCVLLCCAALVSCNTKKYYPAMYEPATGGDTISPAGDKVVIMTEEYAVEESTGLIEDEADTVSFKSMPATVSATAPAEEQVADSTEAAKTATAGKAGESPAVAAAATDKISKSQDVHSNLDGSPLAMRYHVVVGSFQSEANALNLSNVLKKQGCNSIVVVTNNSKYRVFYYSTNDESDLREHLAQARKLYPDAWMLDTLQ